MNLTRYLKLIAICNVIAITPLMTAQAQSCPPCYINQVPPVGNGTTSHGRRIVKVFIDPSWNIDPQGNSTPGQTNVNIWNGVAG